jgi:hypothetical protein
MTKHIGLKTVNQGTAQAMGSMAARLASRRPRVRRRGGAELELPSWTANASASRSRCRSCPSDGPAGQREVGSACHKAVPRQPQASPRLPQSRPADTVDRSCP